MQVGAAQRQVFQHVIPYGVGNPCYIFIERPCLEGITLSQTEDTARRAPASYPARITVRSLFSDMDVFRHINNSALSRYFEEGRADLNIIAFGAASITAPVDGEQILFATATIDFLAPARYPGSLEIGTGVLRIGKSSYTVAQAAFQGGNCVAL